MRYGGDEFVCGLTGIDLSEAERRFALISDAIETEAHVTISVDLAALQARDTPERLVERADAAMLALKRERRGRRPAPPRRPGSAVPVMDPGAPRGDFELGREGREKLVRFPARREGR